MQKLDFDPYDFQIKEIEGIKVYYKDLPLAPCTHIRWSISNGASNDDIGKEGTAHFLEHVLFDGNPMLPKKTDVDVFSRKYLLDSINAYTSFYNTVLLCNFLPKNTNTALDAIYNIVYKPLIRDEDIEHERKVITQETWARLINPTYTEYLKNWSDNLYQDVPSQKRMDSPCGWIDTISAINKDDLVKAHRSYVKENTHVVLVGNITDELFTKVAEIIKLIPNGDKLEETEISKKISPAIERRWIKSYSEIGMSESKQTTLNIIRLLEKNSTDHGTLDLMTDFTYYLMMKKLRQENSWCYSISAQFSDRPDYIYQSIDVKVAPENAKDAEEIIWQTIGDIINGKYKEDFEATKQTSIDSLLARERVSEQIATNAEHYLMIDKKIASLAEIINDLEKVKYDDIVKHFSLHFKKEDVFTELIVPNEEVAGAEEKTD